MIVTDFEIDHFREGPPLRVLDLGNGLNVALVHSQGGHDLLLNFIPATLYGPDWYSYQSLDTSVAQLTLRTEQGVFTVERDAGLEQSNATIFAPDGSGFSQAFIDDLVDGMSPGNFREVFTFSLDRVVRQDEAKILRIARFLRDRSPATAPEVQAVKANLKGPQLALNDLAEIIGQEATKKQSNGVSEKTPLRDRPKVEVELKKADNLVADGRQKLQHLTKEIAETQCALALNRAHARLSQVDRDIAAAQPKKSVTDASVNEAAIERLNDRINDCKAQLKQLADEKNDILGQIKELGDGNRIKKHLVQIEAMLLHEKSMLKEEDALEQIKLNIENLEARLESERLQETEQLNSSLRAANPHELTRLDSIANRIREVENQRDLAENRLAQAQSDQIAQAEIRAIDSLTSSPVSGQDAVSLHQAERRLADLQQQMELDDQMHRLDAERANIVARVRRLHQEQLMPAGRMAVLCVLFAVGIALVLWGLFMHGGVVHWQKVMIGGTMAILASLIKMVADRESVYALENERGRLAQVNHQLEALAANHSERGLDTAALARQIELTENEIVRLRSQFSTDVSIDDSPFASLSTDEARFRLEDLNRRHQELSQDWRDLLIELNLSPTYSPAQARDALAERAAQSASTAPALSDTESQLRVAQSELDRRRDWIKALASQARQLVKDLGHAPGDSLIDHFDILRDSVVVHREHEQSRKQLGRSLKRLRQKESQIKQAGRRYSDQKKQASETHRLKKEEGRAKRQLAVDRLKLLQDQRERLQEDIDEIRGRYGIETQTPLADFADEELEQRLENQQEKQASLRDQVIQHSERRGQLRAELAAVKPIVESVAWAPIVDKTKLLAEQLTAAETIENVASGGQTPFYLHRAAEYLETLSGGQFQTIECPTDETLILGDEEGRSISLDRVRHEHFPNIYFSLWLARIEVYSDRGVRLPVILEDPLKVTESRRKNRSPSS